MAPLESIEITAFGATVGALAPTTDGFAASLTPATDAPIAMVTIAVDGTTLPHRPRIPVGDEARRLRLWPQYAVLSRSTTLTVSFLEPAATQVGAVIGDGVAIALQDIGSGEFLGELPPWDVVGPQTVTILVDGTAVGPPSN